MSVRPICIKNTLKKKYSKQQVQVLADSSVVFIGKLLICHTSMVLPKQRL